MGNPLPKEWLILYVLYGFSQSEPPELKTRLKQCSQTSEISAASKICVSNTCEGTFNAKVQSVNKSINRSVNLLLCPLWTGRDDSSQVLSGL